MHALVGVIIFLIPTLLFGMSTEGDVYFMGSTKQDDDLATESKGILGGIIKLANDTYYLDMQTQCAVPFDTLGFESNVSILGETYFPWGGASAHLYYQDGNTIYRDYFKVTGEIYRTVENPQSIIEYGDIFDYSSYRVYENFDHMDNALYVLYKNFFRRFALHTYFDFSYRYFNNYSDPSIALAKASAEIFITKGIKRNIGLKYGFYINKNITSSDSLLYVNSDLHDTFAYDLYTFYVGSTIYHRNLLLKPEISYRHQIYNSLAEEHPFTENGIKFSLYVDYPLNDHMFIYSNSNIYIVDQSSGVDSYIVTLGVRYSFAK